MKKQTLLPYKPGVFFRQRKEVVKLNNDTIQDDIKKRIMEGKTSRIEVEGNDKEVDSFVCALKFARPKLYVNPNTYVLTNGAYVATVEIKLGRDVDQVPIALENAFQRNVNVKILNNEAQ